MGHPSYPIDNNFTSHEVTAQQSGDMGAIRGEAKLLAQSAASYCPEGRELSIARTKIEEFVFWVNAGIARQGKAKG